MTLFLACLNICYASNLPLLLWILTHALAYTMLSEPLLVDFSSFEFLDVVGWNGNRWFQLTVPKELVALMSCHALRKKC